ncbi:hypothetical protein BpHYR1_021785, partial [Brachionus plicatilis]
LVKNFVACIGSSCFKLVSYLRQFPDRFNKRIGHTSALQTLISTFFSFAKTGQLAQIERMIFISIVHLKSNIFEQLRQTFAPARRIILKPSDTRFKHLQLSAYTQVRVAQQSAHYTDARLEELRRPRYLVQMGHEIDVELVEHELGAFFVYYVAHVVEDIAYGQRAQVVVGHADQLLYAQLFGRVQNFLYIRRVDVYFGRVNVIEYCLHGVYG